MEQCEEAHCAASLQRQEEVQALLSEVLPKLEELDQAFSNRLDHLIECYNRLNDFWGDYPKPFYSKFYNVVAYEGKWVDLNDCIDLVWTQCCQFDDSTFKPLVKAFEEACIELEKSLAHIKSNLKSLLDCCFEFLCSGQKTVFADIKYPSLLPKQRYRYSCSLCDKVSRAIFFYNDKCDFFEPTYFFGSIQEFKHNIGFNNWICYFNAEIEDHLRYMTNCWNDGYHPFARGLLKIFIKAVVMGDTTIFDKLYDNLLTDSTFNSYDVSKPNLYPN